MWTQTETWAGLHKWQYTQVTTTPPFAHRLTAGGWAGNTHTTHNTTQISTPHYPHPHPPHVSRLSRRLPCLGRAKKFLQFWKNGFARTRVLMPLKANRKRSKRFLRRTGVTAWLERLGEIPIRRAVLIGYAVGSLLYVLMCIIVSILGK